MLETLLFCAMCLPNAPVAKPIAPAHQFYDRFAKVEITASLSVAAFDIAQSCHNLATGGREYWLPGRCHGVTLVDLGFVALEEVAAYALHRHGHHKLERILRLVSVEEQTRGIIYSKQHGAW